MGATRKERPKGSCCCFHSPPIRPVRPQTNKQSENGWHTHPSIESFLVAPHDIIMQQQQQQQQPQFKKLVQSRLGYYRHASITPVSSPYYHQASAMTTRRSASANNNNKSFLRVPLGSHNHCPSHRHPPPSPLVPAQTTTMLFPPQTTANGGTSYNDPSKSVVKSEKKVTHNKELSVSSTTSTPKTTTATTITTTRPIVAPHFRRPRTQTVTDMEEFWTLQRATPIWEDDNDNNDNDHNDTDEVMIPSITETTSWSSNSGGGSTSRPSILYHDDHRSIAFRQQ
jgi:hypothetical protein